MRFLVVASTLSFVLTAGAGQSEVAFPSSRTAVGPDEFYVLENYGEWTAECIKDKNSDDYCNAASSFAAANNSLELDFSVVSIGPVGITPDIDVDLVPRALLAISPYSASEHYDNFSAAITALDGAPFDGYWCPLTDLEACQRGPEVTERQLDEFLSARAATVAIYDHTSTPHSVAKK